MSKKAWQKDIEEKVVKLTCDVNMIADGFNERLSALEDKPPERVTQYFVSMDKKGWVYLWNDRPSWHAKCQYTGHYEYPPNFFDKIRQPIIPGLQPGMLCLAEKHKKRVMKHTGRPLEQTFSVTETTYKLLSVLECNLDIDVDWRKCPFRPQMDGCDRVDCPPQSDKFCYVPYLPDTDVRIEVDFNEKKPATETPTEFFDRICKDMPGGLMKYCFCENRTDDAEQLRHYKALFKEDESHEAHVKAYIECMLGMRSCPRLRLCYKHEQPKLITIEMLEKHGVADSLRCWFIDQYGSRGSCILSALLQNLAYTGCRGDLWWAIENLWDYA